MNEDRDLGAGESMTKAKEMVFRELRGPALFKLLNPHRNISTLVYPELYYVAACECMTVIIAVSIVITLIVQPLSNECIDYNTYQQKPNCMTTTLARNAIKDRIGHNNPCVFFDMPPARYFAAFVYVFAAYFAIRYTMLDMERTILVKARLSSCKYYFSIISDWFYMLGWVSFAFTFVIPPYQNIYTHSAGFMCLGTAQSVIFLSNAMEGVDFPKLVYVFCGIYIVLTIVEFGFVALANFIYYDVTGGEKGPLVPAWLGFIVDYSWFACLGLTTAIMPRSEGLQITTRVAIPSAPTGAIIGKDNSDESDEGGGFCGICVEDDDEDDDKL